MAAIDPLIMENVQRFLDKLRSTGITISKAYIFRSYATGRADKWSDIDIAIVSPLK